MAAVRTPEGTGRERAGPVARWGPAVALMAAIFVASATPDPPEAAGLLPDKLVHAAAYGALALLYIRALSGSLRGPFRARTLLIAVALAGAYGATDEIHQAFVPPRQPDVLDLLADVAGAAAAAAAVQWWAGGIIRPRPWPLTTFWSIATARWRRSRSTDPRS